MSKGRDDMVFFLIFGGVVNVMLKLKKMRVLSLKSSLHLFTRANISFCTCLLAIAHVFKQGILQGFAQNSKCVQGCIFEEICSGYQM